MYNIVNPLEMTRKEFEGYTTIHNLEHFTAQQLAAYGKDVESLIQKAQFEELSPEDKEQLDIFKGDMATLTKVVVVNDDLSKEPLFFRVKRENSIEKSHKANVGEIRVWNGKRVKKQANGKWVEVSIHNKNKKEHEKEITTGNVAWKTHQEAASKLSDKEYSDEEVMGGEKKMEDMSDQERKEYLKTSSKELLGRMQSHLDKKKQDFAAGEKKEKKVDIEAGQTLVNSDGREYEVRRVSKDKVYVRNEDGEEGEYTWNEIEEFDIAPKQ